MLIPVKQISKTELYFSKQFAQFYSYFQAHLKLQLIYVALLSLSNSSPTHIDSIKFSTQCKINKIKLAQFLILYNVIAAQKWKNLW